MARIATNENTDPFGNNSENDATVQEDKWLVVPLLQLRRPETSEVLPNEMAANETLIVVSRGTKAFESWRSEGNSPSRHGQSHKLFLSAHSS